MGIQDREYYRRWLRGDSQPKRPPSPSPPSPRTPYRPRAAPDRTPSTPGYLVRQQRQQRERRRRLIKFAFLFVVLLAIAAGIWALNNYGVLDGLFSEDASGTSEAAADDAGGSAGTGAESTESPAAGNASPGSLNEAGSTPAAGNRSAVAPPTETPPAECPDQAEVADLDADAEFPTYIVKTGDTMSAISRRIGIPVHALIALNPDVDPDIIHAGDVLRIGTDAPRMLEPRPRSGIEPDEMADLQWLALSLVNDARQAEGLRQVTLGTNLAPQGHAEDMAEHCFLSHWGTTGLKPYMRYSLAGGVQANAENVSGSSFCPDDPSRYAQKPLPEEARAAFEGLMNSPGHRANILRPQHRVLHLGMAYRAPNFWLVQHFSGHYAAFAQLPEIANGRLSFDMSACNGAQISNDDLGVQVRYDPLPAPLTPGQLQRTACYSSGHAIAALRPPLGRNRFYTEHDFTLPASECLDPYSLEPDLPAARSYKEADLLDLEARSGQPSTDQLGVWITADLWAAENSRVRVDADIEALLDAAGSGVYTIVIWGSVGGESVPIAEYSIIAD